ncbi:stealth family protein [[Clostridium] symbiosum]|uniref:stealth family protein n=1 Tax=Clostridium symbiosum TaxID=1512 RepID=UPI001D062B84|nr:stealth family protein [[Clostridium] symbiosum]MCB6608390.1 Stealth CR1 domain-containing protein [[Clostridium] symbiosum]MCB6930604.1 Stealth CR1 domain-containing protein [[Clostridium] symbiosum]
MKKEQEQVIDFVIPWVDGADIEWRKQKKLYCGEIVGDGDISRYRDWDVLRYWFRGVEKYAPWVNRIHFITCGQCPEWLNLKHEKLHFVKHEDYIPKEFLPTFSSHTIELNLHLIKGLAEQFVYFNDDIFLTSTVEPTDFFKNGLPCTQAVMNAIANTDINNYMPHILMNIMGIINMNFDRSAVTKNWSKWYNLQYGKNVIKNILLSPWKNYTGFYNEHLCTSFLKKTFFEVWDKESEILSKTCRRKVRTKEDVNQYLIAYWQLLTGQFTPGKMKGKYLTIGQNSAEQIYNTIAHQNNKIVCVNDDPFDINFEFEKKNIIKAFDFILPQKSRFEN